MLTKKQKEVLDFIKSSSQKKGYSPSLEEIQKHFKLASVSTAHFHVTKLKEGGYLEKIANQARAISIPDAQSLIRIPLLGRIAAGTPIEAVQEKETIAVPQSKVPPSGEVYALRVTGNSMIDENINDGDVVIIKKQQTAENGQKIVALIDGNEATLKKYYKERGRIRLQPANKELDPIILSKNREFKIQGVVIDVIAESQRAPNLIITNEPEKTRKEYLPTSRENDFVAIQRSLKPFIKSTNSKALLAEGDSLDLLKRLPDNSVSLILTDPPYHSTKKQNIQGDTAFKEDAHYLDWMSEFAKEWRRVLKPHGSLFCFCSSEMESRLELKFSDLFNILSHVVWTKPNEPGFDGWKQKMKKEALRQWYGHTERIIFAEPGHDGNLHRSYFGNLLRELRKKAGISGHELTELAGAYGRVNHGGAVSNWEAGRNIPSLEQYEKICKALLGTNMIETMPAYEDVIRPFKMDASKEFTDVWTFPSVRPYSGKHPAEKPMDLLLHAIQATTYPGDIVLDCFSGSGNTGLAALRSGRRAVLMEIDPKWVLSSAARLAEENIETSEDAGTISKKAALPQQSLFSLSK